jgi:hypothetical protein
MSKGWQGHHSVYLASWVETVYSEYLVAYVQGLYNTVWVLGSSHCVWRQQQRSEIWLHTMILLCSTFSWSTLSHLPFLPILYCFSFPAFSFLLHLNVEFTFTIYITIYSLHNNLQFTLQLQFPAYSFFHGVFSTPAPPTFQIFPFRLPFPAFAALPSCCD